MSGKNTGKLKTKKTIIYLALLAIGIVSVISIFVSSPSRIVYENPEDAYNAYCGSCHLVPNPKNISKSSWTNKVLPEMAARMGYQYKDYTPYKYSMQENHHIRLTKTYPQTPILDSTQWQQIQDYVLSLAPDSVPNAPLRKGRDSVLTQFNSSLKNINNSRQAGGILNITYDSTSNRLLIGDLYGKLHEWEGPFPLARRFSSPIVSSVLDDNALYFTEIGILNPSENSRGTIYRADSDTIISLYRGLHRPVYSEVNDLNEDGAKEIIICEFGNRIGELSMLVEVDSGFQKRTLLALPGSIKVEVIDMNGDGKKDIVALLSQGREGIYIFYQKEDLEFVQDQVIMMGPEYGSSWFSLIDYNKDGHLDIVLTNGDNADYSTFLKPYHGIRLFLNNGQNEFEEKWFYPINGATQVLAEDFDMDGDLDFAVLSFFPDFADCLEEGFVYLENKDAANYVFESSITEDAKNGNWLVMDKGDFDQDGDVDIMLGNFNMLTASKFKDVEKYDILYLENTALEKKE